MLLQLKNISKEFPGVMALNNVSLDIQPGEVHALCGENGAGKSTLMNILSGNLPPTKGEILSGSTSLTFQTPLDARQAGIAIVHQERSLFDNLNIAENIFAGQQPVNKWGLIDFKKLYSQTKALLKILHLEFLAPDTSMQHLPVAHQQMVEIAKALSENPSVLILDEPTASITGKEVKVLFHIIRDMKEKGNAVIYISHRIHEIFDIADKVSVLKDGKYQGTRLVKDTSPDELVRMMIGRDLQPMIKTNHAAGKVLLEINNLNGKAFKNISFSVKKGEIAGLAGLVGAGRTEIAKAIFGADTSHSGTVILNGKEIKIHNVARAIASGISYVPEERKSQGLFLQMSLEENIISAKLSAARKKRFFSSRLMSSIAIENKNKFRIVSAGIKQPVQNLSGGNQQKVVLAKWLMHNADLLIIDEPTHGIDVGAKFEIYELLQQQAAKGKAILLISSELPELLLLSDTIYVLYKGSITKRFTREEVTEEKIMHYATGLE